MIQVFTNILVNACDALEDYRTDAPSGYVPKLLVKTEAVEQIVRIEISDNGPGIPEELRLKIFDDFFTTKAAGKGTGIGLALSRKFIDDHGGSIWVNESTELGGATFQITLPADTQDSTTTSTPQLTSQSELD